MEKHFCTTVYVFSPRTKKFLLIKHKKLGKWMEPGGHIELNEDPEEASIRETFEETGLHVKLIGERFPEETDYIQPLALQKHIIKPGHIHMDIVYMAVPIDDENEVIINNRETDGIKWFSLEEILDDNFETFNDVKFWCKKIKDNMGSCE